METLLVPNISYITPSPKTILQRDRTVDTMDTKALSAGGGCQRWRSNRLFNSSNLFVPDKQYKFGVQEIWLSGLETNTCI